MFRRGASTRAGDVEEQRQGAPEMMEGSQSPTTTPPRTRRLSLRLPQFSNGRRRGDSNAADGGHVPPRAHADGIQPGEVESPKSPNFNINLTNMPSTRLHLPNLARTWTRGSSGPPTRPSSVHEAEQRGGGGGGDDPRPSTVQSEWPRPTMQEQQGQQPDRLPVIEEPQPARTRQSEEGRSSFMQHFRGADPAEMHLADMADRGRQRTRRRDRSDGSASGRASDPATGRRAPSHFLFCFPWIKSRRVRNQVLRCFVSGMLLILTLSVYLALSLTKNINNSEFTILLILIILATTIFFCHGLIKLCLFVMRPQTAEEQERARLPNMFHPGGYAIPRRPIRVVLARDEEAAGLESETNKLQPPAYGLWRESVRVDPNRIYWARNEQSPPPTSGTGHATEDQSSERDPARPATARPPSYASEDGVAYVVEARPRSMAPLTDVPLPPPPAEPEAMPPHRPAW
ncbi:hypothetical protein PG993_011234 [Apiospora rasikravindrae]|uniref:Uncharacterized protein n=1 Tax=Apiospora rasikravindrae TaxID=990691 RepID=A0ABR1SDS4_9PEZI